MENNKKHIWAGAAFLALAFFCNGALAEESPFRYVRPEPAPAFVFEDANHLQHTLKDLRGRVVVLNIWATWCPSCLQEMPTLDALQKKFDQKKLVVLPVAEQASDAAIVAYYNKNKLKNLPVALDAANHSTQAFDLEGLPTTVVIDPAGNEIARVDGGIDWTSPEVVRFLREHLSK